MSDERIKKIVSAPAAAPNTPSIMSAPRDKKKVQWTFLIVVGLAISIALNIVLAVVSLSKNERMRQLESEIVDYKEDIIELKNKLNALDTF